MAALAVPAAHFGQVQTVGTAVDFLAVVLKLVFQVLFLACQLGDFEGVVVRGVS